MDIVREEREESKLHSQLTELYERWFGLCSTQEQMSRRLDRSFMISFERFAEKCERIEVLDKEIASYLDGIAKFVVGEFFRNPNSKEVLRTLKAVTDSDFKRILPQVEIELKEQLGARGVDVEEFLRQQPEEVQHETEAGIFAALKKHLPFGKAKLELNRQEALVEKLGERAYTLSLTHIS